MNKTITLLPVSFLVLISCYEQQKQINQQQKQNIIYIMADDLGYGDLSCYGQKKFSTPNIDKLAENGLKFTQHYSGSTVCAPSRSSLMTGQHTGHTFIRENKEVQPEGQFPLKAEIYTLAEALQEIGYVTGAFVKWGLGYPGSEGDPNNQGFDEFYGYNCQRQAHRYYPMHLWHNNQKVMLEGNDFRNTETYAPHVIHEQALKFIESNKDNSFFMYYPNIIPHAELIMPEGELMQKYRGRFPETPYINNRQGSDYGDESFVVKYYTSQPEPRTTFAAMVSLLDKQVGEVLEKLKELGIDDNTIVIFTSDNGPLSVAGADPEFFNSNGGLRGVKRDLYEGGIRVPMIAYWPGTIQPGQISKHISAFWDVMPTFADIASISVPENIDGISFLPELQGKEQKTHDHLYWEFHGQGGKQALRKRDWKLVILNVVNDEDPIAELYNLKDDPGEQNDLSEEHPEIVSELKNIVDQEHVPSKEFPFP